MRTLPTLAIHRTFQNQLVVHQIPLDVDHVFNVAAPAIVCVPEIGNTIEHLPSRLAIKDARTILDARASDQIVYGSVVDDGLERGLPYFVCEYHSRGRVHHILTLDEPMGVSGLDCDACDLFEAWVLLHEGCKLIVIDFLSFFIVEVIGIGIGIGEYECGDRLHSDLFVL
jgi:hypothetical protein